MLGYGPIASAPIGGDGFDFYAPSVLVGDDPDEKQRHIEVATWFERRLIQELHSHPERLTSLDRRDFEQLVAEMFDGFGYDVELTARTRDGGKDVIAIRRKEVRTRILIECKRPDAGNPVVVGTVRELYGVLCDDGASKAILATTSRFTQDARAFIERNEWRLEGRDFDGIQGWVSEYLNARDVR